MPENVPTGLLSRGVEVVLLDDLVDTCKPGDRVQINGVYMAFGGYMAKGNGIFKTVVVATSVT